MLKSKKLKQGIMFNRSHFIKAANAGVLSTAMLFGSPIANSDEYSPFGAAFAQSVDAESFIQAYWGRDDYYDAQYQSPVAGVIPVESYFHEMASNSTEPVGVAYVFGIDVSGSISSFNNEYQSQLNSLAETIESSDFRQAIFMPGGPGSAAIMVADYGTGSMLTVGWIDLRENDPERFQQVANIIRSIPRRESGVTNHHFLLQNAIIGLDFLDQRWGATRKLVIVKTDGTGTPPSVAPHRRTLAERHGASISTLVTTVPNEYVYGWTRQHLTTPANTFIGPNGQYVPPGITVEVATELQTQGTDIASYRDRVLLAIRRLTLTQTAQLEIDSPYIQFAQLD
jgi:hypothetical protein